MKKLITSLFLLGTIVMYNTSSAQLIYTDANGTDYNITTINGKEWMASNYMCDKFSNGEAIPLAKNVTEWKKYIMLGKPAYCFFGFNAALKQFGFIYNVFAVRDPRNIAPTGWQVPSKENYVDMVNHLGGSVDAVAKLCDRTAGWPSTITITNTALFSALPGGYLNAAGVNVERGITANFWCSTVAGVTHIMTIKETGVVVAAARPGKKGKIEQGYMLRLVKQ
jgi:uncharacterized protein (TIGR02145 family)